MRSATPSLDFQSFFISDPGVEQESEMAVVDTQPELLNAVLATIEESEKSTPPAVSSLGFHRAEKRKLRNFATWKEVQIGIEARIKGKQWSLKGQWRLTPTVRVWSCVRSIVLCRNTY